MSRDAFAPKPLQHWLDAHLPEEGPKAEQPQTMAAWTEAHVSEPTAPKRAETVPPRPARIVPGTTRYACSVYKDVVFGSDAAAVPTDPDRFIPNNRESVDCPTCGERGDVPLHSGTDRDALEILRCPRCGCRFHITDQGVTALRPGELVFP